MAHESTAILRKEIEKLREWNSFLKSEKDDWVFKKESGASEKVAAFLKSTF
jgi:hypothetical protein